MVAVNRLAGGTEFGSSASPKVSVCVPLSITALDTSGTVSSAGVLWVTALSEKPTRLLQLVALWVGAADRRPIW